MILENIEFDDFNINDDKKTGWTQVCEKHKGLFKKSLLDDVGSGTCGVKGCWEESSCYLDFLLDDVVFTNK